MANGKQIASIVAIIVAMVLAISSMILREWLSISESGISLNIGLKTLSLTGPGISFTGTFAEAVDKKYMSQDSADIFNKAGDYILGFGIVAIMSLFASLVLASLAITGSARADVMHLKVASCLTSLLSALLIVIGFVLWAQKFNVGYSFTLSIIASFLFFAAATTLGSGRSPSKTQQTAGLALKVIGLIILITSLATVAWVTIEGDTATTQGTAHVTRNYGLKTWKYVVTLQGREVTSTGKLADGPGDAMTDGSAKNAEIARMKELDKVGTNVIVCGTLALVVIVIAFVFSFCYICRGPQPGSYQVFGVIASIVAGVLTIIGVLLFADNMYIGASYIMFVASSFLCIAAFVLLIATYSTDGATSTSSPPAGYKAQHGDMGLPTQIVYADV